MASSKCPVCGWPVKSPVNVRTPKGVVGVCCQECAEKLRAEPPAKSAKGGGR